MGIRTTLFSVCLIFALGLGSKTALAWPPTFGTEFNFTNKKLHEMPGNTVGKRNQEAANAMADQVKRACGSDCSVMPHEGKFGLTEYRIGFKDGWWFNISSDPGVVEIQTLPETAAMIRSNVERLQKYIFDQANA